MYETQIKEMESYYQKNMLLGDHLADQKTHDDFFKQRSMIFQEMDEIMEKHKEISSAQAKSALHTIMAKYCEPVLFKKNPFFFEIGMREANSWGISNITPAKWMDEYLGAEIYRKHPELSALEEAFAPVFDFDDLGLCSAPAPFDQDHHTLGYTMLFSIGVKGVIGKIREQKAKTIEGSEAFNYCEAMEQSCQAILTIAEKFVEKAKELSEKTTDEVEKSSYERIMYTAKKIPANPPETFYEGLAFLLFIREVSATLEGLGISQLGHVDRLLGPLYEADLQNGRITEQEARELIGIWMLPTDIKFDLKHNTWPETSTCIQLGGCDKDGNAIYNDVTKMFIEEHLRLGLVNPKLNCRYGKNTPEEFLQVAGAAMLSGHNNFVMINDDVMIPGLMKSGVKKEDARMYVNGGCQETMIEGFGHTEGVGFYASMPRVLDFFLHKDAPEFVTPIDLEKTESFEAFYTCFLDTITLFFDKVINWRNKKQALWKEITVAPFFSATQSGCIETATDYSQGGSKYNFSTISLIGLATLTDSLYAIKTLVYERKICTLAELIKALSENWEGKEEWKRLAISLPKYGHNQIEADEMADRFLKDFTARLCVRENERGGTYIPSLFVYYHFESFSHSLRATPDGRSDFELISSGAAPGRLREIKDVTMSIKTMKHMDFTVCGGGSAVLDVKLPLSKNMTPQLFAALIRSCGGYNCPTIQPNVVSQEELIDAQKHPEKHQNLIVRICGLSGYFVALTEEVQNEIIGRNMYQM